jgi:hypothetical protein
MEVTLHIPDDVAKRLSASGGDVSRRALEALALGNGGTDGKRGDRRDVFCYLDSSSGNLIFNLTRITVVVQYLRRKVRPDSVGAFLF